MTHMTAGTPVAWSSGEEAAAVGRHRTMVSRARANDPKHPAYLDTETGRFTDGRCAWRRDGTGRLVVAAPEDAVRAYWENVRKLANRGAYSPPKGLSRRMWVAVMQLADHPDAAVTDVMRRRLAAAGMLDDDGHLTEAARKYLANAQPPAQEQP